MSGVCKMHTALSVCHTSRQFGSGSPLEFHEIVPPAPGLPSRHCQLAMPPENTCESKTGIGAAWMQCSDPVLLPLPVYHP